MILNGRSSNFGFANDKYKFTGKERDTETNYDYFGARYYDSELGRWLQVDPLADKYPGWSPYNYTLNNPLFYVDPDGKDIKKAIKHFLTAMSCTREAYGGASLVLGGTVYAPPSGGTSTFGIAAGIEFFGHGVVGAGLNIYNASVELYSSLTGKNDVSKAPEGLFELVATQIEGVDQSQIAIAKLVDIINTTIGSQFDPGVIAANAMNIDEFNKLLENVNSIDDLKNIFDGLSKEKRKKKIPMKTTPEID
jgi:RHS repeat-associated protein